MSERDANQLAADVRPVLFGTGAEKARAALDELVALVGTLQRKLDETDEWATRVSERSTDAATAADEAIARAEAAEKERDEYRIESDCGLRDYDALELHTGILVEAVEQIAKTRPNQTFDPWARDIARHSLDLFTEEMKQTPGPSWKDRAEAAEAELRREDAERTSLEAEVAALQQERDRMREGVFDALDAKAAAEAALAERTAQRDHVGAVCAEEAIARSKAEIALANGDRLLSQAGREIERLNLALAERNELLARILDHAESGYREHQARRNAWTTLAVAGGGTEEPS